MTNFGHCSDFKLDYLPLEMARCLHTKKDLLCHSNIFSNICVCTETISQIYFFLLKLSLNKLIKEYFETSLRLKSKIKCHHGIKSNAVRVFLFTISKCLISKFATDMISIEKFLLAEYWTVQ